MGEKPDTLNAHGERVGQLKKRGRILLRTGLAVLVLLSVLSLFTVIKVNTLLRPVDPSATDQNVTVIIPSGATINQIALILEEKGVVRSALAFRQYVRYYKQDTGLMAGEYLLSPSMKLDEIIEKLRTGQVVPVKTNWFTIPEGYDMEKMAHYLHEQGLVSRMEFLAFCKNPPASLKEAFPFLQGAPVTVDYLLEGYLFPARYEVKKDATVEEIVVLMLRQMQKIFTEENLNRLEELNLSIHEILTLASIIEKEAASEKERDIISSVFHNRLKYGWTLGSCATVKYAFRLDRGPTLPETKMEHPFNTYLISGLPPGPIGSPGSLSIMAALYPAETGFFFFVTKKDGSGEHYFSVTLAQHEYYKDKSELNERMQR